MVEIEHHACAFHQLSLKNIKIKKKKKCSTQMENGNGISNVLNMNVVCIFYILMYLRFKFIAWTPSDKYGKETTRIEIKRINYAHCENMHFCVAERSSFL